MKTGKKAPKAGVPCPIEAITARCVEEGECLLWQGHMGNGSPQVYVNDRYWQCRRVVFEAMRGPIPAGRSPVMKCRSPACLNHDHMALMTPAQIGALAAKEGKFATPERRARIALARRNASEKLDSQKVAEILACDTAREAAQLHGIHKSMAARIRRGEAWAPVAGASVFTFRP